MDKKLVSLIVALPILALFLFLEVTGVLEVDEQSASAGDIVVEEPEVIVDTTPSAVEREELQRVLGASGIDDGERSGAPAVATTADDSASDTSRDLWTQSLTFYPVVRTVDGDTIIINVDGVDERVRFIGVDTPETVHPRRPVECFGREASAFTGALMTEAGEVALEIDDSQGERDRYGRLLGYVILPDGRNLNALIIYEGYGHEYTYRTEYKYQAEFKLAEDLAREAGRGLWGEGVCEAGE